MINHDQRHTSSHNFDTADVIYRLAYPWRRFKLTAQRPDPRARFTRNTLDFPYLQVASFFVYREKRYTIHSQFHISGHPALESQPNYFSTRKVAYIKPCATRLNGTTPAGTPDIYLATSLYVHTAISSTYAGHAESNFMPSWHRSLSVTQSRLSMSSIATHDPTSHHL